MMAALSKQAKGVPKSVLGGSYVGMVEVSKRTRLIDDLKRALPWDRDEALRQLDNEHNLRQYLDGIDRSIWELMGPEKLRSLASSSYVEIGSHAYAHCNLGLIPLEDAVKDMARSKEALQSVIEGPVDSIAYPDGTYSDAVKDAATRLGFKRQLAVDFRCASDPLDGRIQARHGIPQLKGSSLGRVKIYGIANTHADFMLFRNGFKLIFALREPGAVSVRFHYVGAGFQPAGAPVTPGAGAVSHAGEEDLLIARWGAFGDLNWTFQEQPIKVDYLTRYYLTRFIRESAK